MKNIIEIKGLSDLRKLYEADAYVIEDCGETGLEELLEHYGEAGATGYVFTGKFIYRVCDLPEASSLPKDRIYLAIVPDKKIYEGSTLVSLAEIIWGYSNYTGYNAFEERQEVREEFLNE